MEYQPPEPEPVIVSTAQPVEPEPAKKARSGPKWETDTRDRLKAGIRRFSKLLAELADRDGEHIVPPYLSAEDGTWRAYGKKDGDRPEPAMEELLTFAVSKAQEMRRSELSARWTENGPEVLE